MDPDNDGSTEFHADILHNSAETLIPSDDHYLNTSGTVPWKKPWAKTLKANAFFSLKLKLIVFQHWCKYYR